MGIRVEGSYETLLTEVEGCVWSAAVMLLIGCHALE